MTQAVLIANEDGGHRARPAAVPLRMNPSARACTRRRAFGRRTCPPAVLAAANLIPVSAQLPEQRQLSASLGLLPARQDPHAGGPAGQPVAAGGLAQQPGQPGGLRVLARCPRAAMIASNPPGIAAPRP
ncbi:hypothetical protein [Candidatus Mycobacterium methanotrophicum]|uniref:Uncharacterized protein n=1 Tax=Candidatus Mycobacterium methanotrophicum TaxID=2943498 RepID=A0ABY4QG10_9MYCO|nr:hypothetical protein [Candidatus Mycobacterium methanotrophicum]UQX09431.1 hypothetical protein M5I08_13470 [Candidatus Mycobacterium methanotrophicum]